MYESRDAVSTIAVALLAVLAAALPERHLLALLAPPSAQAQEAPRSPTPAPSKLPARVVDVADGLEHPWGLAFLPDGRLLVTERPGRLRLVEQGGRVSEPLAGVPQVYARGQGGLLDVTLSPSFPRTAWCSCSFAEPGAGGASTAVARGRLGERGLEDTRVIWRQEPKVACANHWGSRLLFRADGTLFVTLGDRFGHREQRAGPATALGKVVRINADGSVPRDNPFVGRGDALPGDLVVRASQRPGARRWIREPASCGRWSTEPAAATS